MTGLRGRQGPSLFRGWWIGVPLSDGLRLYSSERRHFRRSRKVGATAVGAGAPVVEGAHDCLAADTALAQTGPGQARPGAYNNRDLVFTDGMLSRAQANSKSD